ncbi:anthranilate synthase component I family protein [Candidatus Zinderia endosymbiont of Aphrophora alni]|uniref:anthranilate synthase component I family protein n=1 Tax=Candidatus Zinderia endosymbiont of Aphrophora alni TaxID=3077951 RepID=UPI0030CFC7CA
MSKSEFKILAKQGYNRIPLMVEISTNLDTPLIIYLKLIKNKFTLNTFLLEFINKKSFLNRYSFIGLPASLKIRSINNITDVLINEKVVESVEGNAFDFILKFQSRYKIALLPNIPRLCGGLFGYFGYDSIQYINKNFLFNLKKKNDLNLPEILLLFTEEIIVIDNFLKKIYIIIYTNPNVYKSFEKSYKKIKFIINLLKKKNKFPLFKKTLLTKKYHLFKKYDFIKTVIKAKKYILNGDIMQIQISQCIKKIFSEPPIDLYRALRYINPSPYMYFYNFGDFQIVGSSPETLVKNEIINKKNKNIYKKITIRPLAGTRKRSKNFKKDKLLSLELLTNFKEIAEHIMLIDLARNDISRISNTGTVKVTEQMVLEKYSHVQHIVSNVEGILKKNLSNIDILKSVFPAGTLSGTPKIKAMEIINKLEPRNRGLYGGACGFLSFNGEMDVAILIRTGIIKNNFLYIQSAAGIVNDSIPEKEWEETKNKIKVILKAAENVQNGLIK